MRTPSRRSAIPAPAALALALLVSAAAPAPGMAVAPGAAPAAPVAGAAPAATAAPPPDDLAARAARIHRDAIVLDTHIDLPYALDKKFADVGVRGATDHFDIPRAREGGLTAAFFAIYVPRAFAEAGGASRKTLELIDLLDRVVKSHPRDLAPAVSVADVRRIKKEGRIAALMGIEGGHAIEDSLPALRGFYRLGVRYMTLTHTNTNHWADSSGPFYLPDFNPAESRVHQGLSPFGREVVREMNRLGMMVDISHVSDDTIDDVLEASRAPVFASHSSCRALAAMPRNLTDDQIRRIAARGGVVMINIGSYFLDQKIIDGRRTALEKIRPEYDRIKAEYGHDPVKRDAMIDTLFDTLERPRTSWTRAVDHIEHVLKIAGPEAVGLGTDFDGIHDPPEGLDDVSRLPRLTEELLRRGHSEAVVRKVLGENFLGFMSRVEETARRLSEEPPATARPAP